MMHWKAMLVWPVCGTVKPFCERCTHTEEQFQCETLQRGDNIKILLKLNDKESIVQL